MTSPADLKYSTEHEWVRVEGNEVVIGITDYAQDALGDVVYVDVPKVGTAVAAHSSISEIESTKSVSEVYCPVSGTVVAVNDDLEATPESLNPDPYGAGWIFRIELSDPSELDVLMDAAAYEAFLVA
jgi:glycine cleavage system H protein